MRAVSEGQKVLHPNLIPGYDMDDGVLKNFMWGVVRTHLTKGPMVQV